MAARMRATLRSRPQVIACQDEEGTAASPGDAQPSSRKRTHRNIMKTATTVDGQNSIPDGKRTKQVNKSKSGSSSKGKTISKSVRSTTGDIEDLVVGKSFSEEERHIIRLSLLKWYDENHRFLPWRLNPHSKVQGYSPLTATFEGRKQGQKESTVVEGPKSTRRKKPSASECQTETSPRLPESRRGQDAGKDLPNTYAAEAARGLDRADIEARAYAVWVSEIMAQQTRISVVLDYYNRWMSRWPSVTALAEATQEEVNQMWAGLGYYRRARFLLEGAKYIVEQQNGVFPKTMAGLLKIPGIGQYTAGAIASIAFNQPTPLVDGNVIRVLSRLRAISADPKSSAAVKLHWVLAGELVCEERPGDLNQALMELGAMLCTPTAPACATCPVSEHCHALARVRTHNVSRNNGGKDSGSGPVPSVTDYPAKTVKAAPREETVFVCVVERKSASESSGTRGTGLRQVGKKAGSGSSEFLLVQRPEKGLLAGLWEFPTIPVTGEDPDEREMDEFLEGCLGLSGICQGTTVVGRHRVGEYTHVFSHIRQRMCVERMIVAGARGSGTAPAVKKQKGSEKGGKATNLKWVPREAMEGVGLTSGVKKVYNMVLKDIG